METNNKKEQFNPELIATDYANQYPEKDYHDLQHAVLYGIIAYSKHLAEQPPLSPNKSVEEAAHKYAHDFVFPVKGIVTDIATTQKNGAMFNLLKETFLAGAQWQRDQTIQCLTRIKQTILANPKGTFHEEMLLNDIEIELSGLGKGEKSQYIDKNEIYNLINDAHTLIAKSNILSDEYNPICKKLVLAKRLLDLPTPPKQ